MYNTPEYRSVFIHEMNRQQHTCMADVIADDLQRTTVFSLLNPFRIHKQLGRQQQAQIRR